MANYAKTNIGNEGRVELHEKLSLTESQRGQVKWLFYCPAGSPVSFLVYNRLIIVPKISQCINDWHHFLAQFR